VRQLFEDDWHTSAELWLANGRLPRSGELFRNPAYAETLLRLADQAARGVSREAGIDAARLAWSQGFVAEAVDAFSRRAFRDSSGEAHPGVLTGQDLADHSATWEEPVTLDVAGHTVVKTPGWGQGPVLLQTLATLEAIGDDVLDPSTLHGIHAQAEALKLSFADREAWYGDAAEVPLGDLLSPSYAAERAGLIGETASRDVRPGSPGGRVPRMARHVVDAFASTTTRAGADPTAGEPTVRPDGQTRGDTCHLDVVDRWGNIVSATPSGGWLQSSPVIPELGFPLGSRLQMTWLEEGLPSSLVPGRRPRTTLSPTMVLRDGRPVLACGTPGGDQQDQWQLLFLLRVLVGGSALQEAIDAPMWHTTSLPESFYPRGSEPGVLVVEDRLGDDVVDGLAARGHDVRRAGPWTLGRMCVVARDPATGVLSAAANPRGMQGYACGR
jgi:gamma-glutamyltranspeptidase / glutathione hydrolase